METVIHTDLLPDILDRVKDETVAECPLVQVGVYPIIQVSFMDPYGGPPGSGDICVTQPPDEYGQINHYLILPNGLCLTIDEKGLKCLDAFWIVPHQTVEGFISTVKDFCDSVRVKPLDLDRIRSRLGEWESLWTPDTLRAVREAVTQLDTAESLKWWR